MSSADGQLLRLGAAVTLANHLALRAQAAPLIGAGNVTVDWADVDVVDSSALVLLLSWQRSAQATEHRIEQRNLPRALLALADLYGVQHLLFSA